MIDARFFKPNSLVKGLCGFSFTRSFFWTPQGLQMSYFFFENSATFPNTTPCETIYGKTFAAKWSSNDRLETVVSKWLAQWQKVCCSWLFPNWFSLLIAIFLSWPNHFSNWFFKLSFLKKRKSFFQNNISTPCETCHNSGGAFAYVTISFAMFFCIATDRLVAVMKPYDYKLIMTSFRLEFLLEFFRNSQRRGQELENVNCNLFNIQNWHNKLIGIFEKLQFNWPINWQLISIKNIF